MTKSFRLSGKPGEDDPVPPPPPFNPNRGPVPEQQPPPLEMSLAAEPPPLDF